MPAAFEYIGIPIRTASGNGPPGFLPHQRREEVLRHPAVDPGADGDSRDDEGPDLADDLPDGSLPRLDPLGPAGDRDLAARRRIRDRPNPGLDPTFEVEPPDHPAGNERDGETGPGVESRHLPAEETEEEREGHLVDHRRRDEEREGDSERNPGADEADEHRHRRAGTERGDDAEERGEDVSDRLPLPGQQAAGPLRREERADHPDGEDHQQEEKENLRDLVEEEGEGGSEGGPPPHAQQVEDDEVGRRTDDPVEGVPEGEEGDAGRREPPRADRRDRSRRRRRGGRARRKGRQGERGAHRRPRAVRISRRTRSRICSRSRPSPRPASSPG